MACSVEQLSRKWTADAFPQSSRLPPSLHLGIGRVGVRLSDVPPRVWRKNRMFPQKLAHPLFNSQVPRDTVRKVVLVWHNSEVAGGNRGVDVELSLTTQLIHEAPIVEPLIVGPETTIRDVLRRLQELRTGSVLICQDEQLLGIFTERDALQLMAQSCRQGESVFDAPIEEAMISPAVTLTPQSSVASAIRKMSEGGYRRLPVVDAENRPQGMLTVSGIVHYFVDHFPETVYNLPPDPKPAPQEREGA